MAVYYLDTSAIVKRYRPEKGTDTVDEIFSNPLSQDTFYTSFLAVLELTSCVVRLVRSGQLKDNTAKEIFSRFRKDIHEQMRILPLDDETTSNAISMVEKFGLGSADAVYMATAEFVFSAVSDSFNIIVSSDRELLEAARMSGLTPLDPQNPASVNIIRELRTRHSPKHN